MQYVYYTIMSRDEYIYMTCDNTCKNYMYAIGEWRDEHVGVCNVIVYMYAK